MLTRVGFRLQQANARATGSVRDAPDGSMAPSQKKGGFMGRFRRRGKNAGSTGGASQFPTTNNGQATTMQTPTRTPMTDAAHHQHNGVSPASTTDTAHDYHGDSSPDGVQQV